MDQKYFSFVIIAMAALVIIGNLKYRQATKALPFDKQMALRSIQYTGQLWLSLGAIGLMAVFFLLMKLEIIEFRLLSGIFLILFGAGLGWSSWSTSRKLRENEFPEDFIRQYYISSLIRFSIILGAFVLMLFSESLINDSGAEKK